MQTSIVQADSKLSRKYQTVIPKKIRDALGIDEGNGLIWSLRIVNNKKVVEVYPKPKSWSDYMRGLGKKTWEKVNVGEYINQLRNEW